MNFLKTKLKRKTALGIVVCLITAASFLSPARAAFIQDTGVGGPSGQPGQSFWLKFSQSVNAPGMDITSWTGWPLLSIIAHTVAIIGGYPDESGNVPLASVKNSLIGGLAWVINTTYQQPISSTEYLAYLSRNFHLVTPAYAQGRGWDFLRPVLDIWIVMRNIAYVFFVVVFVAIGFMIMFRTKIDPQTVATIQSSLPKIIVSLILVTFSYAIAGLVVDLAFLLNGLINSIFFNPGGPILTNLAIFGIPILTTVNVDVIISRFWSALTAGGVINLLSLSLTAIFSLVVIVAAFRLFLGLLAKYVTLILSVLLAPFAFLAGALPGQGAVGTWFRMILSSAFAFPAVYLVLNLALYLMTLGQPGQPQYTEIPPFTLDYFPAPTAPPVVGAPPPLPTASRLIGLGVFLAATRIPEFIDSLFKAEKPAAITAVTPELQATLRRIPIIGGLAG